MAKENVMRKVRLEKLTLNIGAGANPDNLKKALKLLQMVSGRTPIQTKARVRLATWGIRPGLPIGAKVTLRGKPALLLLKKLLEAIDMSVKRTGFTENGFSFGIKEYIDIEGIKYDPSLGMIGMEASVTLERPGFAVKKRRIRPKAVGLKHIVTKEDAIEFAEKELGVKIV